MDPAVSVSIPCVCPGTPHADGDTVGLRPKLGLVAGSIVQGVVVARMKRAEAEGVELDVPTTTALVTEAYLLHGIREWSLVDQLGKPVPIHSDTIRQYLLDDFAIASPIGDVADSLYYEPVLRPLLDPASTSSPLTPTAGSTSPTSDTPPKRPRRSRRSSTSTSPTAVTEMTTGSPAGVSSSSRSETLAAP